ncbi:MAG: DNA polymerase III subunit delta, partial [Gemmatimonadota bacterium]
MPRTTADSFLSDAPQEIAQAPAILLAGDEPYLIDKVLHAVLEAVITAPGAEAFDIETRDGAELTAADYEQLVSALPLMNDRRVVVIKNVPAVSADVRDRIKATLAQAAPTLCLIGTGGPTMRGNLYKLWEEHGARIGCELPRKSPRSKQVDFDFPRWLRARAKADFDIEMDRDAADALAETGSDLQSLYVELEKAAMHAGDQESITQADVEAVCIGSISGTVWEWCDAVGSRDPDRSLQLVKQLLDSGESAYRLVPLLATHFCRLGLVVELGTSDPKQIMAALPGRSWYAMAKGLATQAKDHTPETVARALDLLAAADLMLKSTAHREEFVM